MGKQTPAAASIDTDRVYLLERVDDAAVVQVYADGFRDLAIRDKMLVWHLYQAAIAGRDIFYDQRYAYNLEMRDVLEAVVSLPESQRTAVDPDIFREILRYTKLFWINTGPYNNLTARKFVLACTPDAFAAAVKAAERAGSRVPRPSGESLDGLLERLRPMFFDADVDPTVTCKTPPKGQDILTASANNLYSGIAMKDLDGFTERYPLNSRLVKANGRVVEEPYRIGGQYGRQIAAIVAHLTAATPYASPATARALRALIAFYTHGRGGRPRGVRRRVGAGPGFDGRHDQRLRRSVPGRAQHQGRVGSARLLCEPRQDDPDPDHCGSRAVVRGSHALGRTDTASRSRAASRPTPSTSSSRRATRGR